MPEFTHEYKKRRTWSLLLAVVLRFTLFSVCMMWSTWAAGQHVSTKTSELASSPSTAFIDPDIIDSEWNHHVAGYLLVCISLLVLVAYGFPKVAWLHRLWPFLFLAGAVFLAVWSDKEIWPRGALSWAWLVHHDAEARQHKLYAMLLLAMSIVEYLRSCGRLPRFWKTWAFPMLAIIGAGILLVHDHGGSSGLPAGWDEAEKAARVAKMSGHVMGQLRFAEMPQQLGVSEAAMDNMSADADMEGMHHPSMRPDGSPSSRGHGGHVMTASMLRVKEQHLWFTLVGIAVAVFKFVHDGGLWRSRYVPHLWPAATCMLGLLLILYTEAS